MSPCYDRWNYSPWNGPDVVLGSLTDYRTGEEIALFREIIKEPTFLNKSQVGNRLSNKIADYDALFNHFVEGRDVFITLDKSDIFAPDKRLLFKEKLGIIILSPRDFVMTHFLERHHNEHFKALMDAFMPQWRYYKEELNQFSLPCNK
jgi:hypothetical protein